jgi:hypothetical protein
MAHHCKQVYEGLRHVMKQLELLRLQRKKVQDLMAPTLARSAWYSHSEAVLQTLLCSEDMEERKFAVEMIMKLRKGEEQGDLSIRDRVHGDTFNPNAKKLIEICSGDYNVLEPVFTCPLSLKKIKELIETPMVVPYRPVHGQSMERVVKEVTRACEAKNISRGGSLNLAAFGHKVLTPPNFVAKVSYPP